MKKRKKTNYTRNKYIKPMMIPIIVGIITLYLYKQSNTTMERLLIAFVFFSSIIPSTLHVIGMLLKDVAKIGVRPDREIGDGSQFKINPTKKPINGSINFSGKVKTIDNVYYKEVRDLINNTVKFGDLNRQGILEFKSELNYRLGANQYNYTKFQFENDMHEIYTKLKSSKLKDDDYIYLKAILEDLIC